VAGVGDNHVAAYTVFIHQCDPGKGGRQPRIMTLPSSIDKARFYIPRCCVEENAVIRGTGYHHSRDAQAVRIAAKYKID
jgi:hypothetical protein